MLANYHTHTRWCRHGVGEIEDYIEEAIRCGLKELAITEHVPHKQIPDQWRMQWEEFTEYDRALTHAAEVYRDQIRIIKGFECEYYPEEEDCYRWFQECYGYKLLLLGHHRSGVHHEIDNFAKKGPRELHIYADEVCRGLETGLFRFLAHPDMALCGYPALWDKECESAMGQIFQTCQELEIPVEINMNGLRGGRRYPSREAFAFSKNYRLKYLINADAHNPAHLCDHVWQDARAFADGLGIEVMDYLDV